jgi:succinate dehydrogenase hydrophobic anchor subunit
MQGLASIKPATRSVFNQRNGMKNMKTDKVMEQETKKLTIAIIFMLMFVLMLYGFAPDL